MSRKRFTEEFKIEAVRQIIERGFAAKGHCRTIGGIAQQPVCLD